MGLPCRPNHEGQRLEDAEAHATGYTMTRATLVNREGTPISKT